MARPKKLINYSEPAMIDEPTVIDEPAVPIVAKEVEVKTGKRKSLMSKAAHMAIGVDLLGSQTTLGGNRNSELFVTPIGLLAHSSKTNRNILVPYSNIKGAELPKGDPAFLVAEINAVFGIKD